MEHGMDHETWKAKLDGEAAHILSHTCNVGNLRLLFRFYVHEEEWAILQLSTRPDLDELLEALGIYLQGTKADKAAVIARNLRPERLLPEPQKSWKLPSTGTSASSILDDISYQSWLLFTRISFEDWVGRALGCRVDSLRAFLDGHATFRDDLQEHLKGSSSETGTYMEVEKEMSICSPFARWTVASSLDMIQYDLETLCNHLVVKPLQRIIQDESQHLSDILRKLAVFPIRFRTFYGSPDNVPWKAPFATDMAPYEAILLNSQPMDVAEKLTIEDKSHFLRLSTQDFLQLPSGAKDNPIELLRDRRKMLCSFVQHCISAAPEYSTSFLDLTECLLHARNYFSMTAVLEGLRAADSKTDSVHFNMINSRDNYSDYRHAWQANPGLPFLHFHFVGPGYIDAATMRTFFSILCTEQATSWEIREVVEKQNMPVADSGTAEEKVAPQETTVTTSITGQKDSRRYIRWLGGLPYFRRS